MKLYELFKGTEYVGEFTLDEIISITGAHALDYKVGPMIILKKHSS